MASAMTPAALVGDAQSSPVSSGSGARAPPHDSICVIKRNGERQPVSKGKIKARIKNLCAEAPPLDAEAMDLDHVVRRVVAGIHDGIRTSELDALAAETAAYRSTHHPQYSTLAARICVSNLHKETADTLGATVRRLRDFVHPRTGRARPLLSDGVALLMERAGGLIEAAVDCSRDLGFDFFGFRTLERSYLLTVLVAEELPPDDDESGGDGVITSFVDGAVKRMRVRKVIVERPAYMYMRVALGVLGGLVHKLRASGATDAEALSPVFDMYTLLSTGVYTHATPTLFNAGTPNPQLSSCFLLTMQSDSIRGIYKTLGDCAVISKFAGGLGLSIHKIRATGSFIPSTNGVSNGIVPMLRNFNATCRYVDQCFAPETLVMTEHGHAAIATIVPGSRVLVSTGEFLPVARVVPHTVNTNILRVSSQHGVAPTCVTSEHPMLAIRRTVKDFAKFRRALASGGIAPDLIPMSELTVGDFVGFPVPIACVDADHFSADDCRMLGIMIGDGHISKDGKQHHVTVGDTKDGVLAFVDGYLTGRGVHVTRSKDEERHVRRLTWASCAATKITRGMIYDAEGEKVFPTFALHLPMEKAWEVVRGVMETDGSVSHGTFTNASGKAYTVTQVTLEMTSLSVISGVRHVLMRDGTLPTVGFRDRTGAAHEIRAGEAIVTRKPSYTLCLPKTERVAAMMGVAPSKRVAFFEHNGVLWSRITSIESLHYEGVLYDLTMDASHDDVARHTYVTQLGTAMNGGGKRKGSCAVYLEPWHADISDFLKLRYNFGKEEQRCRDLFLALWVPDLFMRRVREGGNWTLFCPNEAPGLPDCWGAEFDALYERYEAEGRGRRTVKAADLMAEIVEAQIETGTPYMLYKDACNGKSNQQHLGTIRSSNLCCEVVQFSSPEETAVCNLSSIALSKFVRTGTVHADATFVPADGGAAGAVEEVMPMRYCLRGSGTTVSRSEGESLAPSSELTFFSFDALEACVRRVVRNLNYVIDVNYYPTPETKRSNMRHRPMGIGVQGLADTFCLMRLPYDSAAATELNEHIFETMYYAAVSESAAIAEEEGAYESFEGSPASKGKFQFDLWGEAAAAPVYARGRYDWEALRAKMVATGLRNSLLLAPMPTASTAQILGNNEGTEPFTSNMYNRRVLSGEFVVVNKHLIRDLMARDLWTPAMRASILANRGSVQGIADVPADVQALYKTVWEIKQKTIIDQAADRGKFICQSQSMNLHLPGATTEKVMRMHMYAWSKGLKTGMYYLRTQPKADAAAFNMEVLKAQERFDMAGPSSGSGSDGAAGGAGGSGGGAEDTMPMATMPMATMPIEPMDRPRFTMEPECEACGS